MGFDSTHSAGGLERNTQRLELQRRADFRSYFPHPTLPFALATYQENEQCQRWTLLIDLFHPPSPGL